MQKRPVLLPLLVCLGSLALMAAGGCNKREMASAHADQAKDGVEVSGWVGAHRISLYARPVPTVSEFGIDPADAEFVAITELYPGSAKPVSFHYLVTGPGLEPYERRYSGLGFGPVTYFLPVSRKPAGPVTVTNLGGEDSAPRILGVRAVTRSEIERIQGGDRFTLMGLVLEEQPGMTGDEQARRIAGRLVADPKRNFDRGLAYMVYYALEDPGTLRKNLEAIRQRSLQTGLPVLLGMVSWWGGTPKIIPDGLGGKFGDLKYQQICYTPDRVHPENEELRKLLGDRYNPHYCLSIPNVWSDTPWLTMNSPHYNAYRAERLDNAVNLLIEISGGDTSWIAGIFLENEARYWDTQATEGTKFHGDERWADFNPCVIAAAAGDGVNLDPADGLSVEELSWLHRNVGRYFQETVDTFRRSLKPRGLFEKIPVYTHSFQPPGLFPGVDINQSPSDWALAIGARTGIEGFITQPSDFDRVREWGPWCNLNREENDGRASDTHLWDLRVAYAMGSVLFNSYNWAAIPPPHDDTYFRYAREFVDGLPSVTLPPVRVKRAAADKIVFSPPGGLQAFTRITVPVNSTRAPGGATVALAIDGGPHRTWFSQRQPLPSDGRHPLTFVFPAPAEVKDAAIGTLRLRTYDADGAEVRDVAAFADDAAKELRLGFDLEQFRALSRLVIQWRQGAPR